MRLVWIAGLTLLLGIVSSRTQGDDISRSDVLGNTERLHESRIHVDRSGSESAIRQLIKLRAGDEVDASRLRQVLRRLELTSQFKQIDLFADHVEGGIDLDWYFVLSRRIKRVTLVGNDHVGTRTLRRLIGTVRNRRYHDALLVEWENRVRAYYVRKGFPWVVVTSRIAPLPDGFVAVELSIAENHPQLISDLSFAGDLGVNQEATKKALVRVTKTGSGQQLDADRLESDRNRLLAFFRKRGFPGAKVSEPIVEREATDPFKTRVQFLINVGFRMEVDFRGDWEWGPRNLPGVFSSFIGNPRAKLLKVVRYEQERNFSYGFLTEARRELIAFYASLGFSNTTVEADYQNDATRSVRQIVFTINKSKGDQIKLDVFFSGNQLFSQRDLRKLFYSTERNSQSGTLSERVIDDGLREIILAYQERGYLHAVVRNRHFDQIGNTTKLQVNLSEGHRCVTRSILIRGNATVETKRLENEVGIGLGRAVRATDLKGVEQRIKRLYESQGYPHSTVDIELSFDERSDFADVVILIDEGPKVAVGDVVLRGHLKTKRKVVDKELELVPGEIYSPQRLRASEQNLFSLGYFSTVHIEPIDLNMGRDHADVLVELAEGKSIVIEPSVWYQADIGSRLDQRMRLQTSISKLNLWGAGINAYLRGEAWYYFERRQARDRISGRVRTGFRNPFLFGARLPNVFEATLFEELSRLTYDLSRNQVEFTVYRRWGSGRSYFQGTEASLGVGYDRRSVNSLPEAQLGLADSQERVLAHVGIGFKWDQRDNPIQPVTGSLVTLTGSIYPTVLGSEETFCELGSIATTHLRLSSRFLWSMSTHWDWRIPYDNTTDTPIEHRLFLGGNRGPRGFDEEGIGPRVASTSPTTTYSEASVQTGGDLSLLVSGELEIPVWQIVSTVLFADAGNVYLTNSAVEQGALIPGSETTFHPFHLRTSAGVGIRVSSPIGPISIQWAWNLQRRTLERNGLPPAKESVGRLHLLVGSI